MTKPAQFSFCNRCILSLFLPTTQPISRRTSLRNAFTLVEMLAVVAILGVVICAVTQIYTTGLTRWAMIYGRSATLIQANSAIDRMNKDLTSSIALIPEFAGSNPVYTLILPGNTDAQGNYVPTSAAAGLLYVNGIRVRYYLSNNTGGLTVTGGSLLWRATAPNGSGAYTPDTAWSLPAGHPLCNAVMSFSLAAFNNPTSVSAQVQLTTSISEGGKTTSYAVVRTVALPFSNASLMTFSIDPRATFLLVNNDPNALLARVVDLQALNIAPGDRLRLESIGAYSRAAGSPDTSTLSNLVFSSTSTIQAYNLLNRVANAIVSNGAAYVSPATRIGGQLTDIPQDFWMDGSNPVTVTVPTGAKFLMIGVPDAFNGNHSDPNSDFATRITKLTP